VETVLAVIDDLTVYILASIGVGLFIMYRYASAVRAGRVDIEWLAFPRLFLAAQGFLSGSKVLLKLVLVVVGVRLGSFKAGAAFGVFGVLDYIYMVTGSLCALGIAAVGVWRIFNDA
jgi:hypothetical protein